MNDVDQHIRAGELAEARAALVSAVRTSPGEAGPRMVLWQLMAVMGEWDKAAVQLRNLASISAEAQMLSTVYGQALMQEKARAEAYAGRAPFHVLAPSSPWIEVLARALSALSAGRMAEGAALRDEAFDAAGDTFGTLDGRDFGWIADADPRLGPCFEAIVAGRWGLVPFEAVASLRTEGPRDLRDVVWLPVEVALRSGQSAAALLPARYPGAETAADRLRLGRATEWDGELPLGQRLWTTDDGNETGLLDLHEVIMA